MKPRYQLVAVLCASVALSTSNCGERPATGPGPEPAVVQASATESFRQPRHRAPHSLLRCRPQKQDVAVERIGPNGGRIQVGPYVLTVPPGALSRPVTIRARIRAGESVNVVEFKPDGLVFETPASLVMNYSNCDVDDAELLQIAVVDDAYQILYYIPSTNSVSSYEISAHVSHFNNYAVAW